MIRKVFFFQIRFSFILLLFYIASISAEPKVSSRVVKIGTFNYYPAVFQDSDGKIKGFYIEILSEIAKQENWTIEYIHGNWNDGLDRIKKSEIDLLTSVAYVPERALYLDYGKIPLLTVWSEVYVPTDSEIDGLLDLKGKKIAVMKGDANAMNLKELTEHLNVSASFVDLPGFEDVLKSIQSKKVHAGVVSSVVGSSKAKELNLKSTGIIFNPFDIFFAVPKGKNAALLATLDDYLQTWKKDINSPYHTSRKHWVHASEKQIILIPRWLYISFWILVGIVSLALIFIFLLRKMVVAAKTKILQNQQQYRDIFEYSPVAICLADFSAVKTEMIRLKNEGVIDFERYLSANPGYYKKCLSMIRILDANNTTSLLLGGLPKDKIQQLFFSFFTDAAHQLFLKSFCSIWEGKHHFSASLPLLEGEQNSLEVMFRWNAGTGFEKDYSRIYLTLVDITALTKIQKELLRQKEELAVTLSCITDAVITFDAQGKTLSMNPKASEITEWPLDTCKDFSIDDWYAKSTFLSSPDTPNPVRTVLKNEIRYASGQIIRYQNNKGSEFRLEQICTPLKDEQARLTGAVLILRDVTQLHKMMEQVQKNERLESLGILAGGIAHDFNNLLGGIFGYLEMARLLNQNENISNILNNALSVFERARNLTNQLLTFSKGGIPDKKTSQIAPLVRDAVSFALSGKDIIKKFDIDNNLALCDFDPNLLSQVIDNITINAAQAMNGKGILRVEIKNRVLKKNEIEDLAPGEYVSISISDSGPGIPKNILSRIFDPFFTTKTQGNGLGLATSFSILQKHGGKIMAESSEGQGATFRLFLPVSHKTEDQSSEQDYTHKGEGIVIVLDDEIFMRETVSGFIQKMGYTPMAVENGQEALNLVSRLTKENKSIKGFIFDLTIPGGMGGKDSIILIRKFYKEGFSIAMSGYSQDAAMENPEDFGFCSSLRKPFLSRELAKAINTCLLKRKTKDSSSPASRI